MSDPVEMYVSVADAMVAIRKHVQDLENKRTLLQLENRDLKTRIGELLEQNDVLERQVRDGLGNVLRVTITDKDVAAVATVSSEIGEALRDAANYPGFKFTVSDDVPGCPAGLRFGKLSPETQLFTPSTVPGMPPDISDEEIDQIAAATLKPGISIL